MSAPSKKRQVAQQFDVKNTANDDDFDESNDEEDMDENEDQFDEMTNQEVQVEFEARNPEDCDFHGIKKLLQQLFLKANINVSELTDTLISQNYVGSVIRQANISDEDEEDEAMDTGDDIFGIISVINLTERQDVECVRQLRDVLVSRCKQAAPGTHSQLTDLLADTSKQLGWILNERFINIPAQIALPSFESLWKECARASQKQMKYAFSHYVLLCKTYSMPAPRGGHKPAATRVYTNEEEEIFAEEASFSCSWSVASERDTGVDGEWDEEDAEMDPQRTLLLIPQHRMEAVMTKLREILAL